MAVLIWVGACVSVLGLAGIGYCIASAMRARREQLDDDAMRARMQRIVAINMAAFFVSAIGLMMVVVGIILG